MSKTMTINQLSIKELTQLAEIDPRFVFSARPHFMIVHFPTWVIRFQPLWAATHYPKLMVEHNPEWVVHHAPLIMADHNIEYLLEKNAAWAVLHIPERLAYSHPNVLIEFDQSVFKQYEQSSTSQKGPGLFQQLMTILKGPYARKFNADPIIPEELKRQLYQEDTLADNKSSWTSNMLAT